MKNFLFSLILIFGVGAASPSPAAKMDSETQTQVVDRLERILSQMEKTDSSYAPSQLRLADLLSERARLRFMNEVEANCKGCKGSVADRKKALSIYEELLPTTPPAQQGAVLFQMAHLFEMAGEESRAIELYEGILKKPQKNSPEFIRLARTALADLLFQKGKFKEARGHYQTAFQDKQTANRGLILYRLAWCEFNLDQLPTAISTLEKLASSPELLTKESAKGTVRDAAFQNDVMRDLATFYARQKVSAREIAQYQKLMPVDQRKELLLFFGSELDRLGQKQAAADVYHVYLQNPELTKEERLDVFVKIAQVSYDKGQSSQSIQDFAVAAQAYKDIRCSENEKCTELQKRMKNYVTELHRSKKSKPDMDLLKAYAIYAKTFPEDTEMAILGAQVAVSLNQPNMAVVLYHHASGSAQNPKLRETALLGEIESAETTGDLKIRESAYLAYLQAMPSGPKAFEVRYQLAHLSYEQKDIKRAADQFRELALDKRGTADLRKKSADLALDAQASLKNDADLEKWAIEFAAVFPAARAEYLQISRKAVLNQTAATTNDEHASKSAQRDALQKMRAVSLNGVSDAEKITHLRNQSILAEKVDDETALMSSLGGLLAVHSLSKAEREKVLARKVGWYERKLNFQAAYKTAMQMRFPALSNAERELRMGTLADLAGLRPQKHYNAALHAGLSRNESLALRQRLVMLAEDPLNELRKQKSELSKVPVVLSETVILVYGKTRNLAALESYLRVPGMSHQPATSFLHKQPFLAHQPAFAARLARQQLDDRTDARLQKTIRERIQLLKQADQNLSEAIRLKDFAPQVLALHVVATQNERMVRDLAALPIPKGLSEKQTQEYLKLMQAQSKPYLVKSKFAGQKLSEFWQNEASVTALATDLEKSRPEIRPVLEAEVRLIIDLAPSSARSRLSSALKDSRPDAKDLLSAREEVRENPEDKGKIEKLKTLELKIGHPLMSSYLEGRLGQIQREKVL